MNAGDCMFKQHPIFVIIVANQKARTGAEGGCLADLLSDPSITRGMRHGEVISLINTSERTAFASACYWSGSFYMVPSEKRPAVEQPLCSTVDDVQIPPFGSRQFPVERGGNSRFSLRTRGDAIVLQMLRLSEPAVKLYSVDSTITFGSEASPSPDR